MRGSRTDSMSVTSARHSILSFFDATDGRFCYIPTAVRSPADPTGVCAAKEVERKRIKGHGAGTATGYSGEKRVNREERF